MIPLRIDNYLFDLYKGGQGKVFLMVIDMASDPPTHLDLDVSVMHQAFAQLISTFAAPVPEDADLDILANERLRGI